MNCTLRLLGIAAVAWMSSAAAHAADRVGDAYQIVVEKCATATPEPGSVCSRQVVSERVVRVLPHGVELSYELQAVEITSEVTNGVPRAVDQCHFVSDYLLFPARVRVERGVVRSVRYGARVDAECGGPSVLRSPDIDAFQRGCASQPQCVERGYAEAYAPYIEARAAAGSSTESRDYEGRAVRLTRSPLEPR